jgi:23S rRNA pseudouridine1911/1915/1917 synthase
MPAVVSCTLDAAMKRRSFTAVEPCALGEVLGDELEVSADEALALIDRGAVYVDGRRARGPVDLPAGAKVMVVLEESGEAVTVRPPPPPVVVLYEDDQVIAVDKPPFVTAQPTPGRVGDSLVDLVSARLGFEAGLVHRLDKETSGVTVFGKTREATSRLAAAFREGRAKKEYVALTAIGLPARGTIDLPLSRDPSRPGRWRASAQANGVSALTHFETRVEGNVAVVTLFPQTGRTHQLRAHLTSQGFPIHGDRLYGGAPGPRCLLHARVLSVDSLTVEAPLPADLVAVLTGNSR